MDPEVIHQSIKRVIDFYNQHPEKTRVADSPAIAVLEAGLKCRATGPGGFELVSDMPEALGGGASAPSPGWLLRAALANCDATLIAMGAAQRGIRLSRLEIQVESVSDDKGLLGMDEDTYPGPLLVKTTVRIAAENSSEEDLEAIVAWAEKHSPVADAVRRSVPVEVVVEYSGQGG